MLFLSCRSNEAVIVSSLSLSWRWIHSKLARSKFGFLCPVAWGDRREYVASGAMPMRPVYSPDTDKKSRPASASARLAGLSFAGSCKSGHLSQFNLGCIVFYRGHLFACENSRAAAKFAHSPDRYLLFQAPPGALPHPRKPLRLHGDKQTPQMQLRQLSASLLLGSQQLDHGSGIPVRVSPLELTSRRGRRLVAAWRCSWFLLQVFAILTTDACLCVSAASSAESVKNSVQWRWWRNHQFGPLSTIVLWTTEIR